MCSFSRGTRHCSGCFEQESPKPGGGGGGVTTSSVFSSSLFLLLLRRLYFFFFFFPEEGGGGGRAKNGGGDMSMDQSEGGRDKDDESARKREKTHLYICSCAETRVAKPISHRVCGVEGFLQPGFLFFVFCFFPSPSAAVVVVVVFHRPLFFLLGGRATRHGQPELKRLGARG